MSRFRFPAPNWPLGPGRGFFCGNIGPIRIGAGLLLTSLVNNFFDVVPATSHCLCMVFRKLVLVGAACFSILAAGAAEDAVTFGFSGPETFPIDPAISQLHAADIDGDGLNDIIAVNNSRSRI